jgi:long-chain acyl-CoA synthetase
VTDALGPPPIVFRDRLWTAGEIAGMAMGFHEALGAAFLSSSRLIAVVMANDVESIALFFALSASHAPVLLLAEDPRSWNTSPPVPPGTRLVLSPAFARLEEHGRALGLDVHVLSGARSRSPGTLPFLACPGFVFLTSGSTGVPRPVYRRTTSLVAASTTLAAALSFPDGAGVLAVLPLDRAYGMNNGLMMATVTGRTLGLLERFDHNDMLALCGSGGWWYWAGTPVMADVLSRSARPGVVRVPPVCSFAGRIPAHVSSGFEARFGTQMRQMYGTTETLTVAIDLGPPEEVRVETAGHPLPGVAVHVGDTPRSEGAQAVPGRLWVRTPWLMAGYGYPPDVSTGEVLDGWWATPDVARVDEDGRLVLVGRLDDRIRSSTGHILDPRDVIAALESFPGVTDVAVVPVETPAGTAFGAVIEAAEAIRAIDVRTHLARRLPSWTQPRAVTVVRRLPRLSTGRVDRRACVALLQTDRLRRSPT